MSSWEIKRAIKWTLWVAGLSLTAMQTNAEDSKPKLGNDCVFSRTPADWRALDDRHLVVWAPSHNQAYLIELMGSLPALPFTETVGFVDGDNNGMICGYGGDKVTTPDASGSSWPSSIQSMRRVDDAELVALGEKYKVKLLSDKKANAVKSHDKQIPPTPERSKAE